MPQKDPEFIVDGIGPLPDGVNSGLAPQLLERTQTSFSINATYRGGYIRNRPGYLVIGLDFGGDVAMQQRFQNGLWQGGAFFKSEYGEEGDVVSISGRIYFLVDKGITREVRDVTPLTGGPDDPNSPSNPIAWLWQAERWMIINDGEKFPIFFDGQISRRSRGPSQVVGTLAAPFNAPAQGSSTTITLTAPYTGPVNENILIGTAFYQVNSSALGYKVTLKTLYGPFGGTYPANTQLRFPNNLIGRLSQTEVAVQTGSSTSPGGGLFTPGSGSTPPGSTPVYGLPLHFITPPNPAIVPPELLTAATIGAGSTESYVSGPSLLKTGQMYLNNVPINTTAFIGAPVFRGYPQYTSPVGMVLAVPFTVPPAGGSADATIRVPYNGVIGAIVMIGNSVFEITATNNDPVPSNSIDITNINDPITTPHLAGATLNTIPEMSVGRMGAYGRGRNAYSLPDGRSFRMTDIVGGSSGSPAVNSRDSVLKETENTYLTGGDFVVPGNIGDIRAIWFTADLDVSLGQGPLMVGTPTTIFSCQAPVDRATWQLVTNPILTVSLLGKGPLGQYGTIVCNSDTIFRAIDGLASLILARRDFDSWGNVPISREVQRVIDEDGDTLLNNATAVQFDNRLLMGCLPIEGPLGIFWQGLVAINFDPVSSLRGKAPSIYDALWTGINTFQFVTGTYKGKNRAFSYSFNSFYQKIELYELLPSSKENIFDNQGIPISWSFETASLFKNVKGKGEFDEVELLDGEIYLGEMRGIINIQSWHRPDSSECWTPWHEFDICADNALADEPKQFRSRLGLGQPSAKACEPINNRPYRIGSNHQVRFQITGACKFMGALFKGKLGSETTWARPVCDRLCDFPGVITPCEPCTDPGVCLQFPLLFYSLSNHKTYSNELLSFQITCPDDSVQTVYVPPGTINYTLPFPPDFVGPYPPLVLGCVSGGNVVREVPDNATQAQIDALVAEMIFICAQAYAESIVVCPVQSFTNEQVFFQMECAEDTTVTYSGTLPAWLTLDTVNNRVIGAAGVITGVSTAAATEAAQAQLDAWAAAAITAGDLTCEGAGPTLIIQGYADGLFENATGSPSGNPTWDGKFVFNNTDAGDKWKASANSDELAVEGNNLCNAYIYNSGTYTMEIWNGPDMLWQGTNGSAVSPLGVYTRTDGIDLVPATVTVVANADPIQATSASLSCQPS